MQFHCIKMRYSSEPKDKIYLKRFGFLSFAENMGKNLSKKYGQKLLDSTKKSTTDVIKIASKSAIQKITAATGDLIGNKITDKITSVSKKSSKNSKMITLIMKQKYQKERYISTEIRQQIIDELRLV